MQLDFLGKQLNFEPCCSSVITTYLLKLMNSKDASCVSAVGADLLPETGRETSILDWQILGGDPLVTMVGCDWLLGGRDQVFLVDSGILRLLAALTNNLKHTGKNQHLSQNLETCCPKLAILKSIGVLFFRGDHNILRLQPQTCIHLAKEGIISKDYVMGIILR